MICSGLGGGGCSTSFRMNADLEGNSTSNKLLCFSAGQHGGVHRRRLHWQLGRSAGALQQRAVYSRRRGGRRGGRNARLNPSVN